MQADFLEGSACCSNATGTWCGVFCSRPPGRRPYNLTEVFLGVSLSPEFKKYAWMQLPFTPGLLRLSQRLLGILPVHSPYADICTAK